MFITTCPTCKEEVEPCVETRDDKDIAICSKCSTHLPQLSRFAIVQLKTMGRYKKNQKLQQAFVVKCTKCDKEVIPKISGNSVLCPECLTELKDLSPAYKRMLLTFSNKTL